jgi:hypothetical protein
MEIPKECPFQLLQEEKEANHPIEYTTKLTKKSKLLTTLFE